MLIEKGFTTPNQYPLSINAIANGASQLSNRDPVMQMSDDQAFDAAEGLQQQGAGGAHEIRWVRACISSSTSRSMRCVADKRRWRSWRSCSCRPANRGRTARAGITMQPFDSIERVVEMLRALMEREDVLVKQLPPTPGSRAEKYAQLLCPERTSCDGCIVVGIGDLPINGFCATSRRRDIGSSCDP